MFRLTLFGGKRNLLVEQVPIQLTCYYVIIWIVNTNKYWTTNRKQGGFVLQIVIDNHTPLSLILYTV